VSSPKPAIAKSVEHFGVRETSLNRLASKFIYGFARIGFPIGCYSLLALFPNMTLNGPLA
ncbi:hypothetical protein RB620_30225, partial [Paenibacillus sp. LHD-117]